MAQTQQTTLRKLSPEEAAVRLDSISRHFLGLPVDDLIERIRTGKTDDLNQEELESISILLPPVSEAERTIAR